MLKNLRSYFLTSLASLITVVAFTGVSPQSMWIFYEPDIPESLK
ncbi:MAG: cyclic lactone autoinducer peptide [Thermoanaerobacteraceae bacterium]|nr:cyclic lactone autoinducer peptide [Thermoanaerobacteraceae bacterium]